MFKEDVYMLGIIGIGIIGGLNLLGFVGQTWYLWSDRKFRAWMNIENRV